MGGVMGGSIFGMGRVGWGRVVPDSFFTSCDLWKNLGTASWKSWDGMYVYEVASA